MDVRGGGPGTREGALLDVANTVERIDAIALAGGSAFGLEAGGGIQAWLAEQGRGFAVRGAMIPIVPGAICSISSTEATRNGDASHPIVTSAMPPPPRRDRPLRSAARVPASAPIRRISRAGSAPLRREAEDGTTVAALAVVNAVGSVTMGDGPWFWAAPFEIDGEYGGRGLPASFEPDMLTMRIKGGPAATSVENTTLAVVVTDADLTKPQAKRLAMIAQTGFARAIYPVHAPIDGDVVFAAATGEKPVDPLIGLTELGMVAANVVCAPSRAASTRDRAALPRRAAGVAGPVRIARYVRLPDLLRRSWKATRWLRTRSPAPRAESSARGNCKRLSRCSTMRSPPAMSSRSCCRQDW